ncbi:MAG: YibE/F family protein [Bacillota bacterium]|nr:YibE/F family protein [Bacillota bacterium]HOC06306.1 YibE/F family protein [Bacillota bacterium]
MKRYIDVLTCGVILALAVAAVLFARNVFDNTPLKTREIGFERARVLEITAENLQEDPALPGLYIGYQEIHVEILTGEFKGNVYPLRNPLGRTYNVRVEDDMEIIVSIYADRSEAESVKVYSYKRSQVTWWLLAIFVLAVIAVSRLKGLKSLLALGLTGIAIICFLVPAVLRGFDPIGAAIITAIFSITAGFYVLNGWSKKTFAAILGTAAGVIIAGTISYLAGKAAYLSGLTMENSEQLMYVAEATGLKLHGLMFAAILIASLGAIMDVGMGIASSVAEVRRVNVRLSARELFIAGNNVGKDLIGTMTNTLILAFTGGLLTLFLLIAAYGLSYNQVSNMDLLSVEVIQALAGSIGIVLTAPITSLLAALLLSAGSSRRERRD